MKGSRSPRRWSSARPPDLLRIHRYLPPAGGPGNFGTFTRRRSSAILLRSLWPAAGIEWVRGARSGRAARGGPRAAAVSVHTGTPLRLFRVRIGVVPLPLHRAPVPPGCRGLPAGGPAGRRLYREKGAVEDRLPLRKRDRTDPAHPRPGDVFGELVLFGKPRPFTAVALTDATVSILPLATLQDLLATSRVFSRNYLRLLSIRLYELERTFPALVQAWPHHRLAKELLHLAEDLGDETPKGTRLTLHITHELLSNLIGASRETVTLLIHKFEEIGLLRREGRDLFLNRERLADYLGVDRS